MSLFQSLLRVLERKDIDTLIADIHGKDLEVEVDIDTLIADIHGKDLEVESITDLTENALPNKCSILNKISLLLMADNILHTTPDRLQIGDDM